MRERPILFSPWSVQRILAGAKGQTRRVVEDPQPNIVDPEPKFEKNTWGFWHDEHFPNGKVVRCPYGDPGDRLYVKEPFSFGKAQDTRTPAEVWEHLKETKQGITVLYRAGGWKSVAPFERQEPTYPDNEPMPEWAGRKWVGRSRSAMFLPRWASRITLEITEIRIQRVQEISEEDAIAEGCEATDYTAADIKDIQSSDAAPHIKEMAAILGPGKVTAKADYMRVWDEINGKEHPWSSNPFCWCISFRRLET